MERAVLKLIEQYGWMLPEHPTSLHKVIEQLTAKFYATQIEQSRIPNLGMHQFNAVHLPKNEDLHLTTEQLRIKAIKIPQVPGHRHPAFAHGGDPRQSPGQDCRPCSSGWEGIL